jgi:hypothetical protein
MNKEYESKKQASDDKSDVCFFAIEIKGKTLQITSGIRIMVNKFVNK